MSGRKRVILLVSPTSGFHRGLLRGICRYSAAGVPWVILRELHNPLWNAPSVPSIDMMRSWKADGAICQLQTLPLVAQLRIPTVVCPITASATGMPAVFVDDHAVARLAFEHLLEQGFANFAFCGFDALPWSNARGDHFGQLLAQRRSRLYRYAQRPDHYLASWVEEEAALTAWLCSLPRPIGIFCANDERATHVAECCRNVGVRIPEDIAILGVDDDQYTCELTYPPISSIALATEAAGHATAALLDSFMSGKAVPGEQRIIVKPMRVARRASTDITAVQDPKLAAALRYIRQNASQIIQVSDVADSVDLSMRRLEQRFRAHFGCTVLHMIQRMRAQHIAQLLTQTNRPIGDIAFSLGYTNNRHIARFFRRILGTTPQAYRDQSRLRSAFRTPSNP